MFEAKLASAALLKKIVESIKDLVTDAPFDCSETAMSLQAMDSSHVALVSLKLQASLFNTYICDRPINLGLSLENMSKALKCANNDDTCMLKFEENDADTILFTFVDEEHDKVKHIKLRTLDIDSEHLGIPDQDYAVICEMPAAEFQKTCKDLSTFSDSLNITASKDGSIIFKGNGDIGDADVVYTPTSNSDDELKAIYLEIKDPVDVNFSMKYMNQFSKAASLSTRVKLTIRNDSPICVAFSVENRGYLRFYLAPKVDDDDMY